MFVGWQEETVSTNVGVPRPRGGGVLVSKLFFVNTSNLVQQLINLLSNSAALQPTPYLVAPPSELFSLAGANNGHSLCIGCFYLVHTKKPISHFIHPTKGLPEVKQTSNSWQQRVCVMSLKAGWMVCVCHPPPLPTCNQLSVE